VQIYYDDAEYGSTGHQLTYFGAGTAWAPAWSPTRDSVVLVSSETRNDEIWIVDRNTWPGIQLTKNEWEWDLSPSFSPNGSEIVFASNRGSGKRQLWVMDASGGNVRQLTDIPLEAWDPVWVKYPDS
jgi:TolB protein